jgi:uncharacterized protein involved in exopolysaccharide biosynthesis
MLTLTTAFRRYAGLVLAITATGTATGVLAARLDQPLYEARALVLVDGDANTEQFMRPGPRGGEGSVEDAVLPELIVALLDDSHDIRLVANGQFLTLSLRGADPGQTAAALNASVERVVEAAARLKRDRLQALEEVLARQREQARRQLDRALDHRHPRWRPPHDRTANDFEEKIFSRYVQLQVALDSVARSREALVMALRGAGNSPSWTDALQAISAVEQRAILAEALRMLREEERELQRLRARYMNEHPRIVGLQDNIVALEGTIRELSVAPVAELEVRESELQEQIEAVALRLAAIQPGSIEEDRLERRLRSGERFYGQLEARHQEALRAAARSEPDLRVFSWATPSREPVGRQGQLQLVLAVFLISLAVAVLDAIMLYWLDGRLEDSSGLV